jgi:hypothetical protein
MLVHVVNSGAIMLHNDDCGNINNTDRPGIPDSTMYSISQKRHITTSYWFDD